MEVKGVAWDIVGFVGDKSPVQTKGPSAAGETLAQLIIYSITRWAAKTKYYYCVNPSAYEPLFLELLTKATEYQKLVLMFDVFERTGPSLSPRWLAFLNFEYREFDTNLTFVINGRDPLEHHWTELAGTIGHIALEPFTLEEEQLFGRTRD